jgi:protein-S-isoprenylcysteine O-methyltransferase Ste14
MNIYNRLFGSGPKGTFYGTMLFILAFTLNETFGLPTIINNEILKYSIFILCTLLTLFIVMWSLYSLPPGERGKKLLTTGAFKYFRHPLYAAFVSVFNFGFAVIMNNWIYFIWALIVIPVWQLSVRSEEKLMLREFGDTYTRYCARTWRFFPKFY